VGGRKGEEREQGENVVSENVAFRLFFNIKSCSRTRKEGEKMTLKREKKEVRSLHLPTYSDLSIPSRR